MEQGPFWYGGGSSVACWASSLKWGTLQHLPLSFPCNTYQIDQIAMTFFNYYQSQKSVLNRCLLCQVVVRLENPKKGMNGSDGKRC